MNKNEILLNMQINVIVFLNQLNTFILIFSISLNSVMILATHLH